MLSAIESVSDPVACNVVDNTEDIHGLNKIFDFYPILDTLK